MDQLIPLVFAETTIAYSWIDFIGNLGVALILGAYLALQMKNLTSESNLYSLLNAVGAALILFSLWFKFNWSAFLIEFFWLIISLYGLLRNGLLRTELGTKPDESSYSE